MLPVPVHRYLAETNGPTLVTRPVMSLPNEEFPRTNGAFDTIKLHRRTEQKSHVATRLLMDPQAAGHHQQSHQVSLNPTGSHRSAQKIRSLPPRTAAAHYQLGGLIGVTCLVASRRV